MVSVEQDIDRDATQGFVVLLNSIFIEMLHKIRFLLNRISIEMLHKVLVYC